MASVQCPGRPRLTAAGKPGGRWLALEWDLAQGFKALFMEERYPLQKHPRQGCYGDFSRPHSQHPATLPSSRGTAFLTPAPALHCVKLVLTPTRVPLAGRGEGSGLSWAPGRVESRSPGGREAVAGPVPQPQDRCPTLSPEATRFLLALPHGPRQAGLDLPASTPAPPTPARGGRRPSRGASAAPPACRAEALGLGSAGSSAQW